MWTFLELLTFFKFLNFYKARTIFEISKERKRIFFENSILILEKEKKIEILKIIQEMRRLYEIMKKKSKSPTVFEIPGHILEKEYFFKKGNFFKNENIFSNLGTFLKLWIFLWNHFWKFKKKTKNKTENRKTSKEDKKKKEHRFRGPCSKTGWLALCKCSKWTNPSLVALVGRLCDQPIICQNEQRVGIIVVPSERVKERPPSLWTRLFSYFCFCFWVVERTAAISFLPIFLFLLFPIFFIGFPFCTFPLIFFQSCTFS